MMKRIPSNYAAARLCRRLTLFVVMIAGLLVLAACGSTSEGDNATALEAGKPQVSLAVRKRGSWTAAASGIVLTADPLFEVNAIASSINTPVNKLEYRPAGDSWTTLPEVRQKTEFRPAEQSANGRLSSGSHTMTVRATDSSGNTDAKSLTFTVDAVPPIWDSLRLGGADVLGMSDPSVAVLLGTDSTAVLVEAEASDDRDLSGITTLLLDAQGESVAEGTGPAFTTVLDMDEYGGGNHRFRLTALDGAGNPGEELAFNVRVAEEGDTALPVVTIV